MYIYPPRPQFKTTALSLNGYDAHNLYFAQPKLNGSCGVNIITNGKSEMWNRHKQVMTNVKLDTSMLPAKGQTIYVGEYLNKSKCISTGEVFNHKFCVFDIIMYNDIHLIGSTFEERQYLLSNLLPGAQSHPTENYLIKTSYPDIYKIESYETGFKHLYDTLTPIDIVEGLVCKKRNAPLENARNELNNCGWQFKVRKETKCYRM